MLDVTAYILLALYITIIVISYFAVRRGWARVYQVVIVGGFVNALVAFAFPLVIGDMLLQALVVGPLTGIAFVALSAFIANHYRKAELAEVGDATLILPATAESRLDQVHRSMV